MAFTHLHFHTSYSFLDGYNPIKKAVARVKELGMKACAITDHNMPGGNLEFQEECKKQGIKPLLGCELYFSPSMKDITKPIEERKKDALTKYLASPDAEYNEESFKKLKKTEQTQVLKPYMYNTTNYHILLIAKNQIGWNNLVKICSIAAEKGKFNARNHCDMDLLRQYSEGLIVTTACIGSYSARQYIQGNEDKAITYIKDMKDIFGDDFYLEIQPLVLDRQHKVNQFYIRLSRELNIKLVATNDVHWTNKEDHDDHDTLLCIGTGAKKKEENRLRYSNDFWIKSEEEMIESFKNQSIQEDIFMDSDEYLAICKEAMLTTQEVTDKVEDTIKLGSDVPLFPNIKIPNGLTAAQCLEEKAWSGLYKYLKEHPELDRSVYEERLRMELDIIIPKGFAPYSVSYTHLRAHETR